MRGNTKVFIGKIKRFKTRNGEQLANVLFTKVNNKSLIFKKCRCKFGGQKILKLDKNLIQQTSQLIARDLGLEIGDKPITEQELFDLVANEVAYMLENRLETLFSLLYRLDVSEKKTRDALSPAAEEPANICIARHIIDRQKQRIFTKQHYKQSKSDDFDGLEL